MVLPIEELKRIPVLTGTSTSRELSILVAAQIAAAVKGEIDGLRRNIPGNETRTAELDGADNSPSLLIDSTFANSFPPMGAASLQFEGGSKCGNRATDPRD